MTKLYQFLILCTFCIISSLQNDDTIEKKSKSENISYVFEHVSLSVYTLTFMFLIFFFFVAIYAQATWRSIASSGYVQTDDNGNPQINKTLPMSIWLPNSWEFFVVLNLIQSISSMSQMNLGKAPIFFLNYCDCFGWTNFNIEQHKKQYITDILGINGYSFRLGIIPKNLFWKSITAFFIFVGSLLVISMTLKWYSIFVPKYSDKVVKISRGCLSFAIGIWFHALYPISMVSIFEIRSYFDEDFMTHWSFAMAWIAIFMICLSILVLGTKKIVDRTPEELSEQEYQSIWGVLYSPYHFNHRGYFLVQGFIEIVLGIVIGAIKNSNAQYIIILSIHILHLFFIYKYKPSLHSIHHFVLIGIQLFKLWNFFMVGFFITDSTINSSGREVVGWILIVIIQILLLLFLFRQFFIFYLFATEMYYSSIYPDELKDDNDMSHSFSRISSSTLNKISNLNSSDNHPQTPQHEILTM